MDDGLSDAEKGICDNIAAMENLRRVWLTLGKTALDEFYHRVKTTDQNILLLTIKSFELSRVFLDAIDEQIKVLRLELSVCSTEERESLGMTFPRQ
ncbi:MAG: hypothetical protein HZA37_01325 [Parcubacteria group bacterium]|nr:hypothetical protein [Parcubacteria group bacterium]